MELPTYQKHEKIGLLYKNQYTKRRFIMNNIIAEKIEKIIEIRVNELLSQKHIPNLPDDIVATDNIGEVIEKLCILHIRTWFLEDMVGLAKNDVELANLKRKIDTCFKQKRPQYIQAINRMIDNSIITNKSLIEDSVKIYKGNLS